MTTFSRRQWSCAIGLLSVIGFVICFFWGTFLSDPVLKEIHLNMLQMSFVGFSGMNLMSFISGFIQAGLWGALTGWVLASSLNLFSRSS